MINSGPMFQSLPHMLFESVAAYADRDAFRYRFGGRTIRVSYAEFGETVELLAHGLATCEVEPGTRVGILSENRAEWAAADFASMLLGCVVVPIHTNVTPVQTARLIDDAQIEVLFVSNRYYYEQVMSIRKRIPFLKRILSFDPIKAGPESPVTFERLLKLGEKHRSSRPGMVKRCLKSLKPDMVCSIVYTSGTSGNEKGVCLHHRGFVSNVVRSEAALRLSHDDVFLSYLPLSSLYERLAGHWCPLYRGCAIFYSRSRETLMEDLRMAKPTAIVGVPRMFEEIMLRAASRMKSRTLSSRLLLEWGLDIGRRHRKRHRHLTGWVRFQYTLADWFVYRRFRQWLGGRLRYPISGGAPLALDVHQFFQIMGVPIVEGYGLTETHLVVTISPHHIELEGSCGKPIAGVDVKTEPDGEILVRTDMIMAGYHNREDLTRDAIDKDGWFHTGDIGHLDEDGLLHITDRKGDMILTSGGESIAPSPIEDLLRRDRFIEDVLLIGNGRPFLTAIVVPNQRALVSWGEKRNLNVSEPAVFCRSAEAAERLLKRIRRHQARLAEFEQVKRVAVVMEPFSVAAGELTPTYKKRRCVLEQRYHQLIEMMYAR